jgi:HEPN domain-containing protein
MPDSATQEWLGKAAEDERVVELVVGARGPWGMAAYHVQQAAEKYIKAALVEAGVAPPKSHDLEQLLALHPVPDASGEVRHAAAMLSAYAWLTRYPGGPTIAESDVTTAGAHLAVIKTWVLGSLGFSC